MEEQNRQRPDEISDRLQRLELENLRLKAELEARKAGAKTTSGIRKAFTRATTRIIAGNRLKGSVKRLIEELPGKPKNDTLADVSTHLIMRLTRIGSFAVLAVVAPLLIMGIQTYILKLQNEKLDMQNQLLGRQNHRLDQSINLEEGNRRSSLVFFMSNIMDRIEDELQRNRAGDRTLSDPLIGRIVSLSQALRPYRYLENDTLTVRQLSPERGQLLFSLINSDLAPETYDRIYARANFNYADLQEANFSNAYLRGAKLANSYFYRANFNHTNLENADLMGAFLKESSFYHTRMDGAKLEHANLTSSHMENISMVGGSLVNAEMQEIHLDGDFRNTNLEGIKIKNAEVDIVNLQGCIFKSLSWIDSLKGYNFEKLDMLVEYYEPRPLIHRVGGHLDTMFCLEMDTTSIIRRATHCEHAVRVLLDASPQLHGIRKTAEEEGREFTVQLLRDPFGIRQLGIEKDSVYLFSIDILDEGGISENHLVRFDPKRLLLVQLPQNEEPGVAFEIPGETITEFLKSCPAGAAGD